MRIGTNNLYTSIPKSAMIILSIALPQFNQLPSSSLDNSRPALMACIAATGRALFILSLSEGTHAKKTGKRPQVQQEQRLQKAE
jgi:hypothetical protein